jgi:hypothetical protein
MFKVKARAVKPGLSLSADQPTVERAVLGILGRDLGRATGANQSGLKGVSASAALDKRLPESKA